VYPTKEDVFLSMAEILAQLGTCDRAKVGTIIIHDGRCVSWGYNGAPPGLPHCSENNHGWDEPSKRPGALGGSNRKTWIEWAIKNHGCRNSTHAEANALAFAARQGISTAGAWLFTTVSPCVTCSQLIIAAGITDVFYLEEYRDPSGIILLDAAKIYTHYHGK
jgi:dCMP deaminase